MLFVPLKLIMVLFLGPSFVSSSPSSRPIFLNSSIQDNSPLADPLDNNQLDEVSTVIRRIWNQEPNGSNATNANQHSNQPSIGKFV